jgi:hypothetical protein
MVNQLRLQSYATADGFLTKPESLLWREADDSSIILGILENGELISTMRLEFVSSVELLSKKLEMDVSHLPIHLPAMLLSRAATSRRWAGKGLNATLRYFALEIAERAGVTDVVGTFVKGSPREKTLQKMGYQFYDNPEGWTSPGYLSLKPVTVVHLNLNDQKQHAQRVLKDMARNAIEMFPLSSLENEIPIVQVL